MFFLKVLGGAVVGAIVGVACGILATMAVTAYVVWMNPNDATAKSVAIVAIAFVPGGFFGGGLYGAKLVASWNWPRPVREQPENDGRDF